MPTFAVIEGGRVRNCISAESKELAEESTGLVCIE